MIYIVDDDLVYQYTTKKSLERLVADTNIKIFSDGEEALDHINKHIEHHAELPDLIFLDLNMPIMDGWEFLEQYKTIKHTLCKKPNIYIVTSSDDDADTKRVKDFEDVDDYLVKPIYTEHFSEILSNL